MKDLKQYKQSKNGNFKVIDTIGVPHPYCITSKLVAFTADNHSGMLGESAILDAEKNNIFCDICVKANRADYSKPILKYKEHEQALLVGCKVDIKDNKELHKYLLSIKELAESEKYAGFAFKKGF